MCVSELFQISSQNMKTAVARRIITNDVRNLIFAVFCFCAPFRWSWGCWISWILDRLWRTETRRQEWSQMSVNRHNTGNTANKTDVKN